MSDACPDCGTEVAPDLLSCPRCRRLTHSDELKRLAAQAEAAAAAGDPTGAMKAWREALLLLPPDSRQHAVLLGKIEALGREAEAPKRDRSALAKGAAGLGAVGLLLWKFKFVVAFVLTKGKLLLLGLTKMSTLFSMILAMGVYWTVWGWKFAAGFVISIYIHEMGHVACLRRYGIPASAPMFIPGLGAFVRLRQSPANAREDARVGLAGPWWGLGAAVACLLLFLATQAPYWAGLARVGGWINLFNLIPVWQLDGGRGFRSLTRGQRGICTAVLAMLWFATEDSMLAFLLLGSAFRLFGGDAPKEPDRVGLFQYLFLVTALSMFAFLKFDLPGQN